MTTWLRQSVFGSNDESRPPEYIMRVTDRCYSRSQYRVHCANTFQLSVSSVLVSRRP